ncbi:hypothetical protein ISF_02546 [Cordyceps fumosorosea ARSEF 2679]|uniref:Uncharacterized protein n=1 Tax=Cordyceps fumosorosea (strain ARSEF 2679) TaxID=1081104 RepID=A0A162JL49_CORFA|nr:hypothetical protein ISF_02546 [Cordyceps fumosorosea ARSEF 2679]OAA70572.1 hypothetical protein ISF_02546 [Cordyceps fumosorosea ARSEF 2679]
MANSLPFCTNSPAKQRVDASMRVFQLRHCVVMTVAVFIRPNSPLQRGRTVHEMLPTGGPDPLRHVSRLVGRDAVEVETARALLFRFFRSSQHSDDARHFI